MGQVWSQNTLEVWRAGRIPKAFFVFHGMEASLLRIRQVTLFGSEGYLKRMMAKGAATEAHNQQITQIAISRKLKTVASASSDSTVRLWNLDGTHKQALAGHEAQVFAVAFSPDGLLLASCSEDNTVRVWDPHTGDCLRILSDVGAAHEVSFTPDSRKVESLSSQDIKVFDIKTECLERQYGQ
ncbi:uncharacterized protein N7483_012844 [Penicillium malachiteum]|uniref:uncharacterized protein n=1 Tax=Penicillium malachiteum TaxID=1324776 RepID=UPI0025490088|nr:uncharacterized protein N7483_012844 [Penicillium malachiteum]KAJ5715663.1 hypothetical protein N7483_012844 [Penicillium malachiteum]